MKPLLNVNVPAKLFDPFSNRDTEREEKFVEVRCNHLFLEDNLLIASSFLTLSNRASLSVCVSICVFVGIHVCFCVDGVCVRGY